MTQSDLLKQALLGARRAKTILPQDAATDAILAQAAPSKAAQILTLAAIQALKNAGPNTATRATREVTILPAQANPLALNDAATWHLLAILNGKHSSLLEETLRLILQKRRAIPLALVPQLLERGRINTKARALIYQVLDPAGRDVAAQNPRWDYATAAQLDYAHVRKHWDAKVTAGKTAQIQQLRMLKPDLGRNLLQATWAKETSINRSRMLSQLINGLSMADEPFLERALNARESAPRLKVIELLSRLPDSRYAQRAQTLAASVFTLNLFGQPKLKIDFNALDQLAAHRDGFAIGKSKNLSQARVRHLQRLIGAVPLGFWEQQFKRTPAQFIALTHQSNWPKTMRNGLAKAAQYQNNPEWATALLLNGPIDNLTLPLINVFETATAHALIMDSLPADPDRFINDKLPGILLLRRYAGAWPDSLTRAFLAGLVALIQRDLPIQHKKDETLARDLLKKCSHQCSYAMADELTAAIAPFAETHPDWRMTVHNAIRTIHFRRDMVAALD